ncbi:TPA: hypothetical protein N0F65_012488 [Lagenidium giganteum]|uniref:Myosin motor domain-containing protein n=1 Tax=Lagenidium giganteum TaxID=4803 RepID=A0AAV2YP23_9STRA|nr:TPA: hypothetical protein N0F65_012488 [Lagenidium giganteum]
MEGIRVYVPDDRYVWLPATVQRVEGDGKRFHVRVDRLDLTPDEEEALAAEHAAERGSFRVRASDADAIERVIDLSVDGMPDALPLMNSAQELGLAPDTDSANVADQLLATPKIEDKPTARAKHGDREVVGAEDMCELSHLHEPAIVYNIRRRFFAPAPYTYTGKIVVAINPYQWIKGLYAESLRDLYTHQPRDALPPHVYATSAEAFRNMKQRKIPQSILVSGESGAGKTETVKIMMEHLASISTANATELKRVRGASGLSPLKLGQGYDTIVQKVLKSNPLLEAFGNAKTIRNDNSSRFGKFTQLQFNQDYCLIGAECRHYLLEKSRVIAQARGERNYHIFYQMLSAHEEKYYFSETSTAKDFRYLQDEEVLLDGQTDFERYQVTCDALTTIGVSDLEQTELFSALCGILRLGQVDFVPVETDKDDASQPLASLEATGPRKTEIEAQKQEIERCAKLLGVAVEDLSHHLCSRTVKARGEEYCVPLSTLQASNNRDALAKELYARFFAYLVRRVNNSISGSAFVSKSASYLHIDLLDIFGFESFQRNGFEQFCINFANEKLQQKFTQDVFKTVQEEYTKEQVAWEFIKYQDNQDMLDLLENSMGLMALLNEECVRPMGSDASFASKILSLHESHPRLEKTRMSQIHFVLHHYAGSVTYNAEEFVEKNKDQLQADLLDLLSRSQNTLIAGVFGARSSSIFSNDSDLAAVHAAATIGDGRRSTFGGGRKTATFMQETVSYKFKAQLTLLMSDISATEVHYVRCIKPNAHKSPNIFNIPSVISQLRCAGVVEAIRITRAAFPNKMTHEKFLRRFVIMKPSSKGSSSSATTASSACQQLIERFLASGFTRTESDSDMPDFVIGRTLIYFGKGVLEFIEHKRTTFVHDSAIVIQYAARRWLARRRMKKVRDMIIQLQSLQRRRLERKRFLIMRVRCIQIQSLWRGVRSRQRAYLLMKNRSATRIQSTYRSYCARKRYSRFRDAVIKVQANIKMKKQQSRFNQLKEEKKEQAVMENEVTLLKMRLEEEKNARIEIEAQNTSLQQELSEVRHSTALPAFADNDLLPPYRGTRLGKESFSFIDDSKLLDDSERMIDYLRKEVTKGRELIAALTQENENLKLENKKVKDAYTAAGASFAALNQHNKQQSKANLRLMSTHAALIKSQEEKMKKYKKQIADLKEDLRMQRNVYSAELMARVQQQDLLMEIINLAESHGVSEDLLEKMRVMVVDSKPPGNNARPPLDRMRSGSGAGRQNRSDTISSTGPVPVSISNLGAHGSTPTGRNSDRRSHLDTIMLTSARSMTSDMDTDSTYDRSSYAPSRSSVYFDDESRNRKSRIGGMFKKMFKKDSAHDH